MRRPAILVLCVLCLSAAAAYGQSPQIGQIHVASGSVLSFHLQTRMNPDAGDSLAAFPKGTLLHVRMLDSIDSTVNRDGSPFRGSIVSPLTSGDQVIVHSDAEVPASLDSSFFDSSRSNNANQHNETKVRVTSNGIPADNVRETTAK
jgi:hypothetical protein